MPDLKFAATLVSSAKSELLLRGYERRTTAGEPRLSELITQYRDLGFEVEVVEFEAEAGACNICYPEGLQAGARYGDIYVRRGAAAGRV